MLINLKWDKMAISGRISEGNEQPAINIKLFFKEEREKTPLIFNWWVSTRRRMERKIGAYNTIDGSVVNDESWVINLLV